jgi:acyl carrier protein
MDGREICNKIKEAIAKISDIDVADITDTASFQDDLLGFSCAAGDLGRHRDTVWP